MAAIPTITRQWILRNSPRGQLTLEDFRLERCPLAEPVDGEVVLRVDYLAMDPAIRGFMNSSGSYAAPIAPGQAVRGMILGTVIRSCAPEFSAGDVVWGFGSWSDHVTLPATQLHRAEAAVMADPDLLHRRGTIGLTAYYGLSRIAHIQKGDRVLVSGAAGAVGSLAGQMSRLMGAACVV
jgi:NADPH-dependent curcumin reductase CurA